MQFLTPNTPWFPLNTILLDPPKSTSLTIGRKTTRVRIQILLNRAVIRADADLLDEA